MGLHRIGLSPRALHYIKERINRAILVLYIGALVHVSSAEMRERQNGWLDRILKLCQRLRASNFGIRTIQAN